MIIVVLVGGSSYGAERAVVNKEETAPLIVRWDDIPPFAASYPKARPAILLRLRSLLDDPERHRRTP